MFRQGQHSGVRDWSQRRERPFTAARGPFTAARETVHSGARDRSQRREDRSQRRETTFTAVRDTVHSSARDRSLNRVLSVWRPHSEVAWGMRQSAAHGSWVMCEVGGSVRAATAWTIWTRSEGSAEGDYIRLTGILSVGDLLSGRPPPNCNSGREGSSDRRRRRGDRRRETQTASPPAPHPQAHSATVFPPGRTTSRAGARSRSGMRSAGRVVTL